MSRHLYLLLAGLLGTSSTAIAGAVGGPCENVDNLNGSTVTLPNNETVECAGSTVVNPAPTGADATVTAPPPPLDPIRDNPGTSVDRIRGTYGDNTGTTGTTGRNNVGDTVGVPDSTGVTRGTDTRGTTGVTGTDRDSRTGVTVRDSTDGVDTGVDSGIDTDIGTTGTRSTTDTTTGTTSTGTTTTGTTSTGTTNIDSSGSVGGTGAVGGTGTSGGTTGTGGSGGGVAR